MTTTDLQKFTIEELGTLIEEATALLALRIRERKERAIADAAAILSEAGVSARELARTRASRKSHLVITQGRTYVNPENPEESWVAGKGRRPKWLGELEARGRAPTEA
jgi:hypothetical protein